LDRFSNGPTGKGATAASIGKLLQFRGYSVDVIKIDPYLNVDPGTLNPREHGEVFVTEEIWDFKPVEDSVFTISEIDQDFGTYERFLGHPIHPRNNITSGQIYLSVILKERKGEFLGKTVQVIPHITDEIKKRIRLVAKTSKTDILITEVGGTVGDIEAMPFLEAIRQFRLEEPPDNTALVHVTFVPFLEKVGQLKSKPSQHSVKALQGLGLQPDVIVGRAQGDLTDDIRQKISLFCNVPQEAVISSLYIDVVYDMPLIFEEQGLGNYLSRILNIRKQKPDLSSWKRISELFKNRSEVINIAMPGKYCEIVDSYVSINEALLHAGAHLGAKVKINWIETEVFEENPSKLSVLDQFDGILLTPGFGFRGVEGMTKCADYAIKHKIPYLGICFGAQLLFVTFCRSILGLEGANTAEVDSSTKYPVVDLLPEQREIETKGGTMRLGAHEILLKKGTKLFKAYGKERIVERFRHRYHIMNEYVKQAEEKGLIASAHDPTGRIINAIELSGDCWIVGVQFHPEFKSRPDAPSPIYYAFIKEALKYRNAKQQS